MLIDIYRVLYPTIECPIFSSSHGKFTKVDHVLHNKAQLNKLKGIFYGSATTFQNLPAIQETWVQFLGLEDPLEKEMGTHSSNLAWRIPIDRGAWQATVHGVARAGHNLATKLSPPN